MADLVESLFERTPSMLGVKHARACFLEAAMANFNAKQVRLAGWHFAAAMIVKGPEHEQNLLAREFLSIVNAKRRQLRELSEVSESHDE